MVMAAGLSSDHQTATNNKDYSKKQDHSFIFRHTRLVCGGCHDKAAATATAPAPGSGGGRYRFGILQVTAGCIIVADMNAADIDRVERSHIPLNINCFGDPRPGIVADVYEAPVDKVVVTDMNLA
jgi:hypothetical protein